MNNRILPDFSQSPRAVITDAPAKQMLTVERDGNQTLVRINSSSLSLLQTCARKSFYTLKQGWRAKSSSPPLIFGTAVHKALEVFYSHPKAERTIPDNFEKYADLMAHGHEAPEPHFLYDAIAAFITTAQPLAMLPDTDKRSIASGVWMLGHYFKIYLHDAYVIYSDEQGPFTERTFSVPLIEGTGLKIELFGTIDVILRNEVTGDLLPGDHKTSSQMGNDFLSRIKPNHQISGYLFGARKAYGMDTSNFLINGLMVKAKPLTARGGPPTFTRQITNRTEQDFEEFADAVDWAVRSYLAWDKADTWPIGNVDACSQWGGCSYLDVCGQPNELRENILDGKYTRGN